MHGAQSHQVRFIECEEGLGVLTGGGTVAQNMFAAKYSFNACSTTLTSANCTSDFAVYGLNVAGATGGQVNLVALGKSVLGIEPYGIMRHRTNRQVGVQRNH